MSFRLAGLRSALLIVPGRWVHDSDTGTWQSDTHVIPAGWSPLAYRSSIAMATGVGRQGRPQAASLDTRTQLRSGSSGRLFEWLLSVYEGTGEVTACLRGGSPGPVDVVVLDEEQLLERQRDNQARTERRRRTEIRRFCVRNLLCVLWTLTYAEPEFDRARVLADCAAFQRRFAERFGRVPWLRVLELHKGGWCEYCGCDHAEGRYHVHLALPNVFLPHSVMEQLWGHGFVHYRKRERRVGEGRVSVRESCRTLSRYVSKYVSKECVAGFAEHGYEVAQNCQVRCRKVRHLRSFADVRRVLGHLGLGELELELSSEDWSKWRGPPVHVFWFAGP